MIIAIVHGSEFLQIIKQPNTQCNTNAPGSGLLFVQTAQSKGYLMRLILGFLFLNQTSQTLLE